VGGMEEVALAAGGTIGAGGGRSSHDDSSGRRQARANLEAASSRCRFEGARSRRSPVLGGGRTGAGCRRESPWEKSGNDDDDDDNGYCSVAGGLVGDSRALQRGDCVGRALALLVAAVLQYLALPIWPWLPELAEALKGGKGWVKCGSRSVALFLPARRCQMRRRKRIGLA
jgi:hypothetical protein